MRRFTGRFLIGKKGEEILKKEKIDWIFKLKKEVPKFLDKLKGRKGGFYHYSLSGDLYSETKNWGLGNSVFATKIYYTLDKIKSLPKFEKENITSFIKNFQRKDGSIYDPLISQKSIFSNAFYAIKNQDFSNIFAHKTRRAETRQSFSVLMLLNSRPNLPYLKVPNTTEKIDNYLSNLNWKKPYDACSHFSHLLFFLYANKKFFGLNKNNFNNLIEFAIDWVNKLQSEKDGCWYYGNNISITQKINGAMKIITGLKVVDKLDFNYPEKLINLCLSNNNFENGCNILDSLYVLHYANILTGNSYRYKNIESFCNKWIKVCREHYFPSIGGFSFYRNKANQYYYGAKITKGLNEPDIHGTVLLLWGIALTSKILGYEEELGFKEFIT